MVSFGGRAVSLQGQGIYHHPHPTNSYPPLAMDRKAAVRAEAAQALGRLSKTQAWQIDGWVGKRCVQVFCPQKNTEKQIRLMMEAQTPIFWGDLRKFHGYFLGTTSFQTLEKEKNNLC